jgi:hypothetical protein
VAEDLTDVTVVSTEFNDVDDEIDGLVIGPTLSILSKKLSVMEVSNDATEALLTVGFSYSSSPTSFAEIS